MQKPTDHAGDDSDRTQAAIHASKCDKVLRHRADDFERYVITFRENLRYVFPHFKDAGYDELLEASINPAFCQFVEGPAFERGFPRREINRCTIVWID